MNFVLNLDRKKRQWLDLGIHAEACMTNMTCGAAGGAISLWVKITECPKNAGIITTQAQGKTVGSAVVCHTTGRLR